MRAQETAPPGTSGLTARRARGSSSADPCTGEADDAPDDTGEEEEYEAPEGRILYREHRRYERDRKLVAEKKKAVLKKTGKLACEVCEFESTYRLRHRGRH